MSTNLKEILSVSGESGLFEYVSQAKAGVIAESIVTKKRTVFGMNAKVTSLADISIYTDDKEIPLKDLFLKMKEKLGEDKAPDAKADPKGIVKFFEEVLPAYDRDKFYVSHMKKVLTWYNLLKEFASLDFEEETAQEQPAEEK